jgi:hypothetical protein
MAENPEVTGYNVFVALCMHKKLKETFGLPKEEADKKFKKFMEECGSKWGTLSEEDKKRLDEIAKKYVPIAYR